MLVGSRAQQPDSWGRMLQEDIYIWDPDLDVISDLLEDDEFALSVWRSFCRSMLCKQSARRGRPAMALNRVLRTGVLKHLKNWSFRGLFNEVQRNLDYLAFIQVFDKTTRAMPTMARNIARIDAQALREINERLCQIAQQRGIIQGRRYRQDTTVSESNIHYPTDSSLLQDGVRVLQRLYKEAEQVVPSFKPHRDRSRAVQRLCLRITRAARGRGEAAKERRITAYRSLLRIVRTVVTGTARAATKLGDRRVTRHLDWRGEVLAQAVKEDLDLMLPRVEKVIQQTRARVCRGINDTPSKLLSLFVPRAYVIRKGKPFRPNEFGRLVDIIEVENGFVSDYQVLDGNPSDGSLLVPGLKRHIPRFGRPPHTVATDSGFWSAKNERDALALGVKRVSIPATGRLSAMRLRIQRSRWFRKAQRWRANGEGRIGILKNVYGLDRCMYKGDDCMERWVGWCVFANNLVVIARAIRRQKQGHEATAGAQGEGYRKAA
jgi:IS5 family transposase